MTNRELAAQAARNCQSNDIEDRDDPVDFLSEKVLAIVRILIPDERLRSIVLADTFAKSYVDDLYTGDVFEDIEDAKDVVGELVAGYIIDRDPMLWSDFESCIDETLYDPDDDDSEDECNDTCCDGNCDHCPYRDVIPRYVYENGLIRRINVRRDSDD